MCSINVATPMGFNENFVKFSQLSSGKSHYTGTGLLIDIIFATVTDGLLQFLEKKNQKTKKKKKKKTTKKKNK